MEAITKNDLDAFEKVVNAKYEGLESLVNTKFESLEKSIAKDNRWFITIVFIIISIATAFIKYYPES